MTVEETATVPIGPSSSADVISASPASATTQAIDASATDAVSSVLALLTDANSAASESDDAPVIAANPVPQLRNPPQPLSIDTSLSPGPATNPDDPPGIQFMTWLREAVQTRRLKINDAKALIHTVDGTAFLVSPGVFQRYAQEHPDLARFSHTENLSTWEWAQKKFEKLQFHRKQSNGLNIWTCEVSGPRKTRRLHGYLLNDARALLAHVPFDNPHLHLLSRDQASPCGAA